MLKLSVASVSGADLVDSKYVIESGDLALSEPMMVEGMLTDAMANIVQCIQLWSPGQFEAHEVGMAQFVMRVRSTLTAAEVAITMEIFLSCQVPLRQFLACSNEPCDLKKCSMAFGAALQNIPGGSTKTVVSHLRSFGQRVKRSESLMADVSAAVSAATQNEHVRSCMIEMLKAIEALSSLDFVGSPSEAVDQWQARPDRSCLSLGLALVKATDILQGVGDFDLSIASGEHEGALSALLPEATIQWGRSTSVGGTEVRVRDLLALPKQLLELPVVAWGKQLLSDSASALLTKFAALAELDGIKDREEGKPEQTSLIHLCSYFIVPEKLTASMSSLTKALIAHTSDLATVSTCDMVDQLVSIASLKVVCLPEAMMSPPGPLPCDQALAVCRLYTAAHHVAAGLAWITATCAGAQGCVNNHQLKGEVEGAIDIIDNNLKRMDDLLHECDCLWPRIEAASGKLLLTPATCKRWAVAVRLCFKDLCRHVLRSMVSSVGSLTKLTKSHTPAIDHYISDDGFSSRLAKSRLLNFASKEVLTQESVLLFRCLSDVSRFRDKFGLGATPGHEDEFFEAISEGKAAFAGAKKVMMVHRACHAMFAMSGALQLAEMKALLLKKVDMPKALVLELERCERKANKPKAVATHKE